MTPSTAATKIIHHHETCKLKAYPDPGSRNGKPWTIGWGHTGPAVKEGLVWTQARADAAFVTDLDVRAEQLNRLLKGASTTQPQFDALLSWLYNVGAEAAATSTLLKAHLAGRYMDASFQFRRWNMNDGKVMRGLVKRRKAEAQLYLGNPAWETFLR